MLKFPAKKGGVKEIGSPSFSLALLHSVEAAVGLVLLPVAPLVLLGAVRGLPASGARKLAGVWTQETRLLHVGSWNGAKRVFTFSGKRHGLIRMCVRHRMD